LVGDGLFCRRKFGDDLMQEYVQVDSFRLQLAGMADAGGFC